MSRGRKTLPVAVNPEPELDQDRIDADRKAADVLATVQAAYGEERDLANQMLGQAQAFKAIAKMADVVHLSKLAQVRELKLYRALPANFVLDENGQPIADCRLNTWDGFCRSLGLSANKVEEDLLNLSALGGEAMGALKRVGAGYRDLRKLRALPDEVRGNLLESPELKQALNEGDKDTIRELIEDMAVAHAKKSAALSAEVEAKDRVIAEKSTLVADKDEQINALKIKTLASRPWDERAADYNQEASALFYIVQEHLARLDALQTGILTADFSSREDEEAVLAAVAVPFSDGLKRIAQMLVALSQRHDKTLGAFAESLDAQPLGDLDALAARPPSQPEPAATALPEDPAAS